MTIRAAILAALLAATGASAEPAQWAFHDLWAASGSSLVTPDQISGLIGWYEADDVRLYGIQVTNWVDKSSSTNHAVAFPNFPATPISSNYSGRASVYFDGGDEINFLSSFYVSNSTIIAVFTRPATSSASVIIGRGGARPLPLYWAGNNQQIYAGFNNVGRATAANNTTGLVCVATSCAGGATNTITVALNGVSMGVPNALSSGGEGPVTRIGSYTSASHTGHIMSLLVYNRQLSLAEIVSLYPYINFKWSVFE